MISGETTRIISIDRKWFRMEMSPKEYGELIGHSESYVRKWCLPADIRGDPEARIRVTIPTADVMENVYDRKGIRREE